MPFGCGISFTQEAHIYFLGAEVLEVGHSYWTRPYKVRRIWSSKWWRKSFRRKVNAFVDEEGEPILPRKIGFTWPMKHCSRLEVGYQYFSRVNCMMRKGKKWYSTSDHPVKGEKE